MAAGNDIVEASSSFSTGCPESFQQDEVLSPEDIAWIDSCLNKDIEVDDKQWDSLKDALLDILSSENESHVAESSPGETDIEMIPPPDKAESANLPQEKDDVGVSNNGGEDSYNSHLNFTQNPFLPTYKDEIQGNELLEPESGSEVSEKEPTSDDIFRIWDLNTPAMEAELVKQLNKAIAESPAVQSTPSTSKDTDELEGLKVDYFDDLISFDDIILGIADLSLNQKN